MDSFGRGDRMNLVFYEMKNRMPMYIFSLNEKNSIVNTVKGDFNGTRVTV